MVNDPDHDELILIKERLITFMDSQRIMNVEVQGKLNSLLIDLTNIKMELTKSSGFVTGARWLWNFLLTLPVGILAWLLGRGEV